MAGAELSVVAPVYNEADNLRPLLDRLIPVLESCARSFEVIFVDDGSTDQTLEILRKVHDGDPRIRAIALSRNFGWQRNGRICFSDQSKLQR